MLCIIQTNIVRCFYSTEQFHHAYMRSYTATHILVQHSLQSTNTRLVYATQCCQCDGWWSLCTTLLCVYTAHTHTHTHAWNVFVHFHFVKCLFSNTIIFFIIMSSIITTAIFFFCLFENKNVWIWIGICCDWDVIFQVTEPGNELNALTYAHALIHTLDYHALV